MANDQRRLAAIVSADVAGYSRLMEQDETGTLAALKAHRRSLIDPKIAEHGGRIVKTTGDGLLLEFPSVVEAVRCAVEVQRGMEERNVAVPPDRRIEFRVGINLGDIIIDEDDIFGDGVNVAARLQTLAEPGTICVGRSVRDQVLDRLGFSFEDLGRQHVKNISRPIEVFRVVDVATNGDVVSRRPPPATWWQRATTGKGRGMRLAAIALVAPAIVGVVAWQAPRILRSQDSAQPFSIAVMPFAAGDAAGDPRLLRSFRESLTGSLAKSPFLKLTSSREVQALGDARADPRSTGRALHVRYLVDGDVRATAGDVAITLHLVDADAGTELWTERFDAAAGALERDVRDLASKAGMRIREAAYEAELRSAVAHPDPKSAVNRYLVADAMFRKSRSEEERKAARAVLDEALRIDPDYLPALSRVAWDLDARLIAGGLGKDPAKRAQVAQEFDRITARMIQIDDRQEGSWHLRAESYLLLGRGEEALAANAKAQSLLERPSADMAASQAWILLTLDRPEEALAAAQRALAIEPQRNTGQEGFALRMTCISQFVLGRYGDAVLSCEQSAARDDWWVDAMWLTAGYTLLGDARRADAAKARLLAKRPEFTIQQYREGMNGTDGYRKRLDETLFAGLRRAGLPEQ